MEKGLHLKGLNGLRAIAALCVVISHMRSGFPELIEPSHNLIAVADYAVTVFFTLSGFLITYLLCLEKEKGGINIRNFYTRRILRIWPLYFAYLFIAIIVIYFESPGKLPGSLPYYLFFAANVPTILASHLPHLAQYWTLGVEEQFYFFWPWIIKRSRSIMKGIVIFTGCFLAVKIICRIIYFETGNIFLLRSIVINRFECLSFGAMAAVLCIQENKTFFKIVTHKIMQLVCWLSLPLMGLNLFHVTPLLDHDLVTLVTIVLIVNLAFNDNTLLSLENRFFDLLGRISYGIYIIHPLLNLLFRNTISPLKIPTQTKLWIIYPGVMISTILLAWLSFEYFERPFLNVKKRYSTVKNCE